CKHLSAKIGEKRRRAIVARLGEGYTVEQLKRAVDGVLKSPYHMGQNDSGTKYDDIELICRSASHVDKFIDLADGTDLTKVGSSVRASIGALTRFVEEKEKQ